MQNVEDFKNLLIKLIDKGKPNMGKNQVVEKIETAYNTFEIMKGL